MMKNQKSPQRRKQRTEPERGRPSTTTHDDDDDAVLSSPINSPNTQSEDEQTPQPKRRSAQKKRTLLQSPRSSGTKNASPRSLLLTPNKRRKKESQEKSQKKLKEQEQVHLQQLQKIQAESFIMKLFDRSLDLSKYTDKTSLYPICRAWMSNQPRNPIIRDYREQKSPKQPPREDIADKVLAALHRGERCAIKSMPAPKPKKEDKDEADKQEEEVVEKCDDKNANKKRNMEVLESEEFKDASKEELLNANMIRWRKASKDHGKHLINGHKRYEVNRIILDTLWRTQLPGTMM